MKTNNVIILPSLNLRCLDMIPRIEILKSESWRQEPNVEKSKEATVILARKKLQEYVVLLNDMTHRRTNAIVRRNFEESESVKMKRAAGLITDYTKLYLEKAAQNYYEKDYGV